MSDDRPWNLGVGVVAIRPSRHFILGKRIDTGQWALPGGKMETSDDSPEGTALRELREETGLSGIHCWALGWSPHDAKKLRWLGLYVGVTLNQDDEFRLAEPESHECWEWFTVGKLQKLYDESPELVFDEAMKGVELAANQGMFTDEIF